MTENEKLRKLLWFTHHDHFRYLYGDDGEMQCSECLIDFKRDSIEDIEARLQQADERDGCVAGCPECIWGGKFPAKNCCEGYEPPTSQIKE